jgi:hypothetical protein
MSFSRAVIRPVLLSGYYKPWALDVFVATAATTPIQRLCAAAVTLVVQGNEKHRVL